MSKEYVVKNGGSYILKNGDTRENICRVGEGSVQYLQDKIQFERLMDYLIYFKEEDWNDEHFDDFNCACLDFFGMGVYELLELAEEPGSSTNVQQKAKRTWFDK